MQPWLAKPRHAEHGLSAAERSRRAQRSKAACSRGTWEAKSLPKAPRKQCTRGAFAPEINHLHPQLYPMIVK
jgi:hypothetical protein